MTRAMNGNMVTIWSQLEELLREVVSDAVKEAIANNKEVSSRYPERVTVTQASEITGYTKNSLYQMHSRGQIPGALKVGGKLLFDTATLSEWVESGGRTLIRE